MALAYLSNFFPALTETFIHREVVELRRRGIEVVTYSLRKPDRSQIARHYAALQAGTHYLLPVRPRLLLCCHLRSITRHPFRYAATAFRMMTGTHSSHKDRVRSLMHFGEGVVLSEKMLADGVSHIHAHFASQAASVARVVSLLTGIPYSFTGHAHDIWHDRLIIPEKLNEASFVVTCSAMGQRALIEQARTDVTGKVHLVYHGLDIDNFPCSIDDEKRERNLILSIGRLTAQKGFPDLVEALSILAERGTTFRCVIVGEGEDRSMLEGLIRAKGLEDRIILMGSASLEEVKKFYGRAWIFVLPCVDTRDGNRDGIPNVLMEAMASGVPVITTMNSGQPELIENGVHGVLVHSHAQTELADAMQALCSDMALRRTIQIAARKRIVEDFDNRKTIEPLVRLFGNGAPGQRTHRDGT